MVNSRILFDVLTIINVTSSIFSQKKISDPIAAQIRSVGYPVEVHTMFTDDGYRIRLHRIPHGRYNFKRQNNSQKFNSTQSKRREPLLLVHGAICSGSMWIHHPYYAKKSLAFLLADDGYDVWLFNARGTSPSLGHKTLTINDAKYWDFSWHEIGLYDITKTIDYVLEKTLEKKIYYAGHSQGCSVFAVALTMQPSYNQKIKGAFLMTPGIFVHNVKGLVKTLVETGFGQGLRRIFKITQIHWWPSKNPIINDILFAVCRDKSMTFLCSWFLLQIIGPLSNFHESDNFLLFFLKHLADNVSVRQLIHLQTLVQKKSFVMYDYGKWKNFDIYGMHQPPEYDLSRLIAPVAIMGATNDALVTYEDVTKLAATLKNVHEVIMLPGNHLEIFYIKDTTLQLKNNMLNFFNVSR